MKTIRVTAAIFHNENKIFATQRGYGAFKDGWEFPGGKIEEGETPKEALVREIREELDTEIRVESLFDVVEYDYPDFHLTMYCHLCRVVSGELTLLEHKAAKWLGIEELDSVAWLPADLGVVEKLRSYLYMRETAPAVDVEWLKAQGAIYIERIQQGLEEYPNEIRKLDAGRAVDEIHRLWKDDAISGAYVDFYYFRLEEDARKRVDECLTEDEIDYLRVRWDDKLIFPLDEELLKITAKLNEWEVLFSTYYFVGKQVEKTQTWWGNYNKEYIIFTHYFETSQ